MIFLEPEVFDVDGLRVYVLEDSSAPAVSVYSMVSTGSGDESDEEAGFSHFVEHMLFKGTPSRSAVEMGREILRFGGDINGFTSYDLTCYTISVDRSGLETALCIHGDAMAHSLFEGEEVDSERTVILEEVKLTESSPRGVLYKEMARRTFPSHPYGRPVIGYEHTVGGVDRETLYGYYRKHYVRENAAVIVVGDACCGEVVSLVRRYFADLPRGGVEMECRRAEAVFGEAGAFEMKMPTAGLAYVEMAFPGVALAHDDCPALAMLAAVLGRGASSRLQRAIRHTSLAYTVSMNEMALRDGGVVVVSAVCRPEAKEKVVEAVSAEVERLVKEGLPAAELERARSMLLAEWTYERETFPDRAAEVADQVACGCVGKEKELVERIRRMEEAEVLRVAAEYLAPHKVITGAVMPREWAAVEVPAVDVPPLPESPRFPRVSAALKGEGLEHYAATRCGMKCVLRRDESVPMVAGRLMLPAGSVRDGERCVSAVMTAHMLVRGAGGRDYMETVFVMESSGIDVSVEASTDYMSIRFESPPDAVGTALAMLRDMVVEPTFPEEEFEKVRRERISAVGREKDSLFSFMRRALSRALWEGHPYAAPPSGEEDVLEGLSLEEVKAFHASFYDLSKGILSVVGEIDPEAVFNVADDLFGGAAASRIAGDVARWEPLNECREVVFEKHWPAAVVTIAWRTPAFVEESFFPLKVLATVLGNPFDSRIWNTVREERGLAYSTGASYRAGMYGGTFSVFAGVDAANLDMVGGMLLEEVERVRREGVTEEEVAAAVSHLRGNHNLHLQGPSGVADLAAVYEFSGRGHDFIRTYGEHIAAVTPEAVQRAAEEFLDTEKFLRLHIRPAG